MSDLSIVVTGACGFIGRRVVAQLAHEDATILAVDRMEPVEGMPANVRGHRSDLAESDRLIPSNFDTRNGFVLVHLAWDMRREGGAARQLEQVDFLAGLLNHWTPRGLKAVVGLGSAEEYGARGGTLREDDEPIEPLSAYGSAKRAACDLLRSWADREQRRAVWLRPFLVYGPGQRGDMMLPYALAQAQARLPADFTDGLQERDFVGVADVARAIVAAIHADSRGFEIINIGTGTAVPVRDVLLEMARLTHAESLFRLGARPRRPGEPDRQVADITKARACLNWTPTISWREGLRELTASA